MHFFNKNRKPRPMDYLMCLFGLPMAAYYHTLIGVPMVSLVVASIINAIRLMSLAAISVFTENADKRADAVLNLTRAFYIHHGVCVLFSMWCVYMMQQKVKQDGHEEDVKWETGNEKYFVDPFERDAIWTHFTLAILNPVTEIAVITSSKAVLAGSFVVHTVFNWALFGRVIKTARYLYAGGDQEDFAWPSTVAFIAYNVAFTMSMVIVIVSKEKGKRTK